MSPEGTAVQICGSVNGGEWSSGWGRPLRWLDADPNKLHFSPLTNPQIWTALKFRRPHGTRSAAPQFSLQRRWRFAERDGYPATVDWRTISFDSTKAVCGGSSSGLVASASTRRAAASPMRWMD